MILPLTQETLFRYSNAHAILSVSSLPNHNNSTFAIPLYYSPLSPLLIPINIVYGPSPLQKMLACLTRHNYVLSNVEYVMYPMDEDELALGREQARHNAEESEYGTHMMLAVACDERAKEWKVNVI